MKTIFSICMVVLIGVLASAQSTSDIYKKYINVKDALIKSDAKVTSNMAHELSESIGKTKTEGMNSSEKKSFELLKESLLKGSLKIGASDDIEKQRVAFKDLSENMWEYLQNAKTIKSTIYYQYCPMKKSYWLSNEAQILNPYYGSKMLNCGNVSNKLN